MALTTESPSFHEDDDNTNNEEVEKKTSVNLEQFVDEQEQGEQFVVVAVKDKKKTNQQQEEDDGSAEDDGKKKKKNENSTNQSKRKLVDDDESRKLNYKKQKQNEDTDVVVVALSADKSNPNPKPKTTTASTSKVNLFEKMWSDEDELVLLKGMIEFKKTHKGELIDSTPKYEILLPSITTSLSFAYTIKQLQNKVRSLKDKYESVVHKLMSGGDKDPFENRPTHDVELYNLSKTYWGDVKKTHHHQSSKKKSKQQNVTCESPEYYYLEQFCKANNGALLITSPPGLAAIGIGKANAVDLNQKAKDLMVAEGEVYLQRLQLIKEHTQLRLDVLKQ